MPGLIEYRAGTRAMECLRRDGLRPGIVRAVAGPASGPKWLVLAGLDRALMDAGLAAAPEGAPPRLLVGASAGSWRMLMMASRDPRAAHARLVRDYIGRSFTRGTTAAQVSEAYRGMLAEILSEDDRRYIASHPSTDVAVHVTRLRTPLPWRMRVVQQVAIAVGAALHRMSGRWISILARRVLLHTRPARFSLRFDGVIVPLTSDGMVAAALASGTIPFLMQPVHGLPFAPRGMYMDGGLADYHLRQPYVVPGEGITLFPHYQKRICAVWYDDATPRRRPPSEALADVLQIHPSDAFLATLPSGRLPDRDEFFTYVDAPHERIRRWTEVVARSEELGRELTQDLASGAWADRLQPI
jgi:hypothetical protein